MVEIGDGRIKTQAVSFAIKKVWEGLKKFGYSRAWLEETLAKIETLSLHVEE